MVTVMHEIEGHPDAMPIYHYLPLPSMEDEPKSRNFKKLSLRRYLTMAGADFDLAEGFNSEDLYGLSFDAYLTKEEIDQEDKTAPPVFRNTIRVPKLED
jgi:hypothetical protein